MREVQDEEKQIREVRGQRTSGNGLKQKKNTADRKSGVQTALIHNTIILMETSFHCPGLTLTPVTPYSPASSAVAP